MSSFFFFLTGGELLNKISVLGGGARFSFYFIGRFETFGTLSTHSSNW